MQCYTEILPPTAVSQALALSFLRPNTSNLLVVKTALLQVFDVVQTKDGGASKLVLIGEYPLAGTVTSLAAVRQIPTRTGGDAALIAFKDAKLSLIEWDRTNHRINTISIHFYEGENVLEQPFGPGLTNSPTILTVDSSSRCAALKFGARHLAILPFWQQGDGLGGDVDDGFDVDAENGVTTLSRGVNEQNGDVADGAARPPYKPSFVLPLTALDPSLIHPIDLAFLHEYREPTFGILSATVNPSLPLLEERKDCLTFSVYTLDLEQRASTSLITVPKLPSDLWKIIPLQSPVGGALMVGDNAFVHVDQGGKVNAVAVNEYATQISDFGMSDLSHLQMKLEGCEVEVLDSTTGDLLIVLQDGSMAMLSFQITGRNIGGLHCFRVQHEAGGDIFSSPATTIVSLPGSKIFVGGEDGPSKLVSWVKDALIPSKKRSHAQMEGGATDGEQDDENMDDIDEDDLYGTSNVAQVNASIAMRSVADGPKGFTFTVIDELQSLAPMNVACLGRSRGRPDRLELLAGVGRARAGRIACLSREIVPEKRQLLEFGPSTNLWSVSVKPQIESISEPRYDNLLFVFDGEFTKAYDIDTTSDEDDGNAQTSFTERTGTEFEAEGETLAVMTIGDSSRIIQIRRTELRTYDHELGLAQIIPMLDEETDAELTIGVFSVHGAYTLIIRDDSTLQVFAVDRSGDVEPLELEDVVQKRKWLSGCLYAGPFTLGKPCVFLLNEEGGLHIFELPDFKECYTFGALPHLPPVLSLASQKRRVGAKETLTELLIADLGAEDVSQTYLILRTSLDDLILYEPFHDESSDSVLNFDKLCFRKVPNTYIPKYEEILEDDHTSKPLALQRARIGHRLVVYIRGSTPSLIVKEPTSLPKIISVRAQNVQAMCSLNVASGRPSFLLATKGEPVQQYEIDPNVSFETGWSVSACSANVQGEEVRHMVYHEERDVYIIATSRETDFHFPDDEIKYQEPEDVELRAQISQCTLHLMLGETKEIISKIQTPYLETITCMKVMRLEVSEQTREQRSVLVVGTAAMHGEDRPAKGTVTVFDLIDVVPEIGRPETGVRLKPIAKEETKGAVTAIEQFPGGLVGVVQGQKIMVRGLKEDGSCLPVAFLDALCNMTTLKSLSHSGMWLAGDAWKGVWFGGFIQEPYRLSVLGKSRTRMEVMAAEFLPFDQQLFILAIDAQTNLQVLQYDPENPKSLSGTRLLHRGAFHIGHFPTSMTLLPSTQAPFAEQDIPNGHAENGELSSSSTSPNNMLYHVLTTTQTGAIGLITPVDESIYRRLAALQTHLTSTLEHAASLNPRAYRAAEIDGSESRSSIIDGSLIRRISELGTSRAAEMLSRAGGDVWTLRSDLETITGSGLDYL